MGKDIYRIENTNIGAVHLRLALDRSPDFEYLSETSLGGLVTMFRGNNTLVVIERFNRSCRLVICGSDEKSREETFSAVERAIKDDDAQAPLTKIATSSERGYIRLTA